MSALPHPYQLITTAEAQEYQDATENTLIERVKNDLGLPGKYVFWKKWENWGEGKFGQLASEVSTIFGDLISGMHIDYSNILRENADLEALPLAERTPLAIELLTAKVKAKMVTKLLKYPDIEALAERYQGKTFGIAKYT